jgi:hypothetical protein
MHSATLSVVSALVFLVAPALADEPNKDQRSDKTQAPDKTHVPDKTQVPDKAQAPDKPLTNRDVGAKEVVETPATDLNIKKDQIPLLLVAAQQRPYTLSGLGTCQRLAAAIGELDAVLGDDVDLPQSGVRRVSPGRVAQSVVGSFIPFRGVIREVSGANAHDREIQVAIIAGVARRSFLKGIGQGKGCRYPARSATLDVFNEKMDTLNAGDQRPRARAADAEAPASRRSDRSKATPAGYVSRPVVQQTD